MTRSIRAILDEYGIGSNLGAALDEVLCPLFERIEALEQRLVDAAVHRIQLGDRIDQGDGAGVTARRDDEIKKLRELEAIYRGVMNRTGPYLHVHGMQPGTDDEIARAAVLRTELGIEEEL